MKHLRLWQLLLKYAALTFDWNEFKNLAHPADALAYAQEHLPEIGHGTGRLVYDLGDGRVLKVAKNSSGIGQNRNEVEVFTNPQTKIAVARIFEAHQGFWWLVVEKAEPLDSLDEFQSIMGISFPMLYRYLNASMRFQIMIDDELAKRWYTGGNREEAMEREYQRYDRMEKDLLEASPNALPFAKALVALMEDQALGFLDMIRHDHWGRTADGRVVLMDYGMTRSLHEKYYRREGDTIKGQDTLGGLVGEDQEWKDVA